MKIRAYDGHSTRVSPSRFRATKASKSNGVDCPLVSPSISAVRSTASLNSCSSRSCGAACTTFVTEVYHALCNLSIYEGSEVITKIEIVNFIHLKLSAIIISIAGYILKPPPNNPHAYCAMPLPNDQFSFGTSKRLTKIFSGLMPGFLASSSAMRANRAFFCSGPRVLLTVI